MQRHSAIPIAMTVAPLAPCLLFGLIGLLGGGESWFTLLAYAMPVSYLGGCLLGLPACFVLANCNRLTLAWLTATGAILAGMWPFGVLILAKGLTLPTVLGGVLGGGFFAACGATVAATLWLIAIRPLAQEQPNDH